MKSKIEAFGSMKKEFPPHANIQLFRPEKPANIFCAARKVEVTSLKVVLNQQTGDLLSNGTCTRLLARHQSA